MNEQEQRAYEYWSKYHWAIDPSISEESLFPNQDVDYKQYLPVDPSHPRAWIPNWVRYAKRKEVDFTCPITGWREGDFFQDQQRRGPIRMIGKLTMDHITPGSVGGLTVDENIRAISELANTKKGNSPITDQELRERLLSSYMRLDLPEEQRKALLFLIENKITYFRMGR